MAIPYEAFFANRISEMLEMYYENTDIPTQFVLVPSLDDATAQWV